MGSLALVTGHTSFEAIFARLDYGTGNAVLVKSLCVVALFIMLLVEGSRVPVDDPTTHLELTMIHEVMILDYSGPDLAFLLYAAGLKMVLIATLIANLLIPPGLGGRRRVPGDAWRSWRCARPPSGWSSRSSPGPGCPMCRSSSSS